MKTQIYLDETGSSTLHHHSNHRISYDKNFVLMSVITISVLILLFMMLGARGQNVNSNQDNPKHKKAVVKKTTKNKKANKLEVAVLSSDTLINSNIKTGDNCPTYTEDIYTVADQMPQFPGGDDSLRAHLRKELKYPLINRDEDIQGTVYVTFVVAKTGDITNVKVLRGIGGGFDEEAVRVVKSMPRWIPGKQNGVAVAVQFNLPIKFSLQ